jgi:hypothetical protein
MNPLRASGRHRSCAGFFVVVAGAMTAAGPASAQLEVLLRGLDAAAPRVGACGHYRFTAQEPAGKREVVFDACVQRIAPGPDGSVYLHLTAGDSLDARLEVGPAFFRGLGGSLLDHLRSVVEIAGRDTTRYGPDDWGAFPGLERTPPLPGGRDSVLAGREIRVGTQTFACHGRRIHESSRQVKSLGPAQMTQSAVRDVETWMNPEAPILGIVRATATVRSERTLSQPVPGVPQSSPRTWEYSLELLSTGARARAKTRHF